MTEIPMSVFTDQLRNLEKTSLTGIKENKLEVSKLRMSSNIDEIETANEIVDEKVRYVTKLFQAKRNQRMDAFIEKAENISKIRAMVADTTCEVPICAGIAELYFSCVPDIFKYFPNIIPIECDYRVFKIVKVGRIDTFASPRSLPSIRASGYTNVTSQLDNEKLRDCVTMTPEYIEGEIALGLEREVCSSELDQLLCYTVDTLDFLDQYIELASIRAFVSYLISINTVANVITPSNSLYDTLLELSSRADASGYSAKKIYITNLEIVDRMAWEKNANGFKTFDGLTIACGDNACKVVCLPNGSYLIGVDTTILPKITNKYQILIVKGEQILGGIGRKTVETLPKDLEILLNKLTSKNVGIRPLKFAEAAEFAGNVVYKSLIS
jgi:hypothetical protein